VIVIFDRVTATKPASKKTWLLHTIQETKINGSTVTVSQREGQLIVQSLLPRDPAIVSIGGPGKQYWVADPGQNYPANRRGTDNDDQGWHGNWRVEISPSKRVASDQFLTVLYPSDPGTPAPACKLIEAQGKVGCEVSGGGEDVQDHVQQRRTDGRHVQWRALLRQRSPHSWSLKPSRRHRESEGVIAMRIVICLSVPMLPILGVPNLSRKPPLAPAAQVSVKKYVYRDGTGGPWTPSCSDYEPASSLVVPRTPIVKPKFPVIDVHTHPSQWNQDAGGRGGLGAHHG
jgi:hypothetical protein